MYLLEATNNRISLLYRNELQPLLSYLVAVLTIIYIPNIDIYFATCIVYPYRVRIAKKQQSLTLITIPIQIVRDKLLF